MTDHGGVFVAQDSDALDSNDIKDPYTDDNTLSSHGDGGSEEPEESEEGNEDGDDEDASLADTKSTQPSNEMSSKLVDRVIFLGWSTIDLVRF
jgi:hypothetical protein